MRGNLFGALAGACLAFAAGPAPGQSASELGHSLTPFGAIRAGNADGTIPPWDGGTTRVPPGFVPGKNLVDPYAAERPLYAITAANVDRYADKLSAGVVAKLRTLPGYRLDVYPSHRNFAAPDYIYQAAIANTGRARLENGGLDVAGARLAIPFPLVTNGSQVIWNHLLRWRGPQVKRVDIEAVVNTDGSYGVIRTLVKILYPYNVPGAATDNTNDYFFVEVLDPPRSAGSMDITRDTTDPFEEPRQSWFYTPGERRVRRAPNVGYDTPIGDTDGIETVDDLDLFNGALDRYDWKLIGRRELYVPYNCYRLQQNRPYSDVLRPGFLNPDMIRWELHRVWVVEATVKPGSHHIYARRTVYVDEDSWQMLISDRYDSRGLLWRTGLAFPVLHYEVPMLGAEGYEYTDLLSHRYFAVGLHGPERQQPDYGGPAMSPAEFTPEALRDAGHR